ncbi:hypothetical protein GCM10023321_49410 [Pseudonocardia eucalypti]|uniref:Mammalian cell entry protein n=1 Tax=Pseudonocardia eucalypti TaxID=648755 RepID=A0ABP9QJU5_9PSEU|nr:phospholipid/cholesterol/gamma-HCH transport system substrate-binding protein [Pseudonocardia eucalypti]
MSPLVRRLAAGLAVALLAAIAWVGSGFLARPVHVTAYFDRASGLHPGSKVTVLGVRVGTVESVTPAGDPVAVRLSYDRNRKVPADAMAVIVAPSLVAGRYVQLAPVYRGGPTLADGATIPLERTAVPVEWDQIKEQLVRLAGSLGPDSAHPRGALNDVIRGASGALSGNGAALRDSMTQLSRATGALARDGGNLFATVRNLNDVVAALNHNSDQVRGFSAQLAGVASVLADNRRQLAQVLASSDAALVDITSIVHDNKQQLGTSVDGLASLARQLADNQVNLANTLHLLPGMLGNFYNAYDPVSGGFAGRVSLTLFANLADSSCQSAYSLGMPLGRCRALLSPLLDRFNSEGLVRANPLVQNGAANQQGGGR